MADRDLASDANEPVTLAEEPGAPQELTPSSLSWPAALMHKIQTQMCWGPDLPGTKLP